MFLSSGHVNSNIVMIMVLLDMSLLSLHYLVVLHSLLSLHTLLGYSAVAYNIYV